MRRAPETLTKYTPEFSKAMTADYVIGQSQTKAELAMRNPDGSGTGLVRDFLAKNRNEVVGVSVETMNDFTRARTSMKDWMRFDDMVYGGLSLAA